VKIREFSKILKFVILTMFVLLYWVLLPPSRPHYQQLYSPDIW